MQKHVFTPKWKRHDKSQDLEPTDTGTENAEFSAALGIVITGRNDQMANHWHYIHTQGHSFFFFVLHCDTWHHKSRRATGDRKPLVKYCFWFQVLTFLFRQWQPFLVSNCDILVLFTTNLLIYLFAVLLSIQTFCRHNSCRNNHKAHCNITVTNNNATDLAAGVSHEVINDSDQVNWRISAFNAYNCQ